MKILDWFYLAYLGMDSFWHIVLLHHCMELEQDQQYNLILTCSCGKHKVIK